MISMKLIALSVGISGLSYKKTFSFSSKKNQDQTKIFIWGNGNYQARPDVSSQFQNFTPKLIKTFLGDKNVNLQNIYFGEFHEAGIDSNGGLYIWKKKDLPSYVDPKNKDDERENIITLSTDGFKTVKFTKGFVWGLKQNGEVYQWQIQRKLNDFQEVEDVTIIQKSRKITTLPQNIQEIETGEDHFVALTKNGEVYTMGDDTYGQCGAGQEGRNNSPPFYEKRVKNPIKVENIPFIQKIKCGHNHTLAISHDQKLFGWGSNDNQQLSHEKEFSKVDDPLMAIYSPVRLTTNLETHDVIDIACGEQISLIVTKNKINDETEVFGTGHNIKGQLGLEYLRHVSDIAKLEKLSNYQITDPKTKVKEHIRVKQIECGANHCMALLNMGAIFEWGQNEYGQLGNKKRTFSEKPLIIGMFNKESVKNISCGWNSSAVICENNQQGQKK